MLIDQLREQAAGAREDFARAWDPDWADEIAALLEELEADQAAH